MDNPKDDAIMKRWQAIEKDQQAQNGDTGARKRPRKAIEGVASSRGANGMPPDHATDRALRDSIATEEPKLNVLRPNKRSSAQQFSSQSVSLRVLELADTEGSEDGE